MRILTAGIRFLCKYSGLFEVPFFKKLGQIYIMCVCVCLYQGRKQLTQTVATEVTFIKLYSHIAFGDIKTSLAVNSRGLR